MEINSDKKISIVVIISSIFILLYGHLAKEYNPFEDGYVIYYTDKGITVPISYYYVEFIGIELPYLTIVLTGLISLSIGVYWFLYKTNRDIRRLFKRVWGKLSIYSLKLSGLFKNTKFYSFTNFSNPFKKIKFQRSKKTENFWSDKGRLRRSDYIIRAGLLVFILAIIQHQIFISFHSIKINQVYLIIYAILHQTCLYIFFMQTIKRIQDIGKNGWWFILLFIPFINILFFIYVIFTDGTIGTNKYGDNPNDRLELR